MVSKFKNIPVGWKVKLSSDVLFFQEGPGVRKWQFKEEGVKLLNGGNINNNTINLNSTKHYLSEDEAYNKYKHFLVDEGDLLIACSGITINTFYKKIAFIKSKDLPLCLNTSTMRFKSLAGIELRYFFYYLQTKYFTKQIQKLITGSAQLNFGPSHMGKIEILLPPIDQQKKIAAILDAADAYRQKTKALITKYEELTQSLFLDMFGDPVRNPMGWEVKNLKDLTSKIHSGNTPKGGSKVYVNEGITFFRSQNVWKNNIVLDGVAYIDDGTHKSMMKSSLRHKDILMTKTGRINTENSSLGRAAMYLGADDRANVNGHVYLIRLNEGVNNEFVLHILTSKEYRGHIRSVCVGGIDKRQLNKGHIEDFPIISPPKEMQEKFIENLLIIRDHKDKLKLSLAQSEDLFNSLLQKAFKGELS
jgi:restriction endonuclease S subunit